MKIYSDNAVTKESLSEVDAKQTQAIATLKLLVITSFVINLAFTIVLFLVK